MASNITIHPIKTHPDTGKVTEACIEFKFGTAIWTYGYIYLDRGEYVLDTDNDNGLVNEEDIKVIYKYMKDLNNE